MGQGTYGNVIGCPRQRSPERERGKEPQGRGHGEVVRRPNPVTPSPVPHGTPLLFASLFAATPPSQAPIMGSHCSTETGPLKVICNCDQRRQHLILAQSVWCHQRHFPVSCLRCWDCSEYLLSESPPSLPLVPWQWAVIALHIKAHRLPTSQTLAGILSSVTGAVETLGTEAGSRLLRLSLDTSLESARAVGTTAVPFPFQKQSPNRRARPEHGLSPPKSRALSCFHSLAFDVTPNTGRPRHRGRGEL